MLNSCPLQTVVNLLDRQKPIPHAHRVAPCEEVLNPCPTSPLTVPFPPSHQHSGITWTSSVTSL